MSEQQRLDLLATLKAGAGDRPASVEGMRSLYDGLGALIPLPATTVVEVAKRGGVRVELGQDAGAKCDRHLLYFHGGGYTIGSVASHRGLVSLLGRAAAARTISVEYRLAPEHPLPAAFDDGSSVYAALLADGIAANQLVVAADSAGGALAIAVLQLAREAGLPLPAGLVLFSPLLDMTASGRSYEDKAGEDALITRDAVLQSRALFLGDLDPRDPLVSPIWADLAGFPPIHLQVGTSEVLLDDALALVRAAMLADVEVNLEAWPRQQHVWQLYASILDEGAASIMSAARFIADVLDRRAR